ncbi:cupin domain-containing protein [Nakamurella sp. A5-74]|uniref:Cupin domain-containing protein n=1 Tax=Nakamurella sp. A5-74 TaxID=3158264 RepID=A0AAU8DU59_9ACTN
MTVIAESDSRSFQMHGSTFTSFVAPAGGSTQLCAWRLDVVAGTPGVPHRVSHEEVLLVLGGELLVDLDGVALRAHPGQTVFVPAGSQLAVAGGPGGARAWVTTSVGLTATTGDGSVIAPPWTQ